MDRSTALSLIHQYSNYAEGETDTLWMIHRRFPSDGSTNKAMRWLGYCQGVLVERGALTLDQVKEHSQLGSASEDEWRTWMNSRNTGVKE